MKSVVYKGKGTAHAFFYCSASISSVEKEIEDVKKSARVSPDLETKVDNEINPSTFSRDSQLRELAEQAREQGNNYHISASLDCSMNGHAARELVNLVNYLYLSPLQDKFHMGKNKFIGGIVYKLGRNYEFME